MPKPLNYFRSHRICARVLIDGADPDNIASYKLVELPVYDKDSRDNVFSMVFPPDVFRGKHKAGKAIPDINEITMSHADGVFLHRSCQARHLVHIQPKSVIGQAAQPSFNSVLDCRICDVYKDLSKKSGKIDEGGEHGAAAESDMARCVYVQLDNIMVTDPESGEKVKVVDHRFVEGARVLPGNGAAADLWLPDLRLLIYLDGEPHFNDLLPEHQKQKDRTAVAECLEQGFNVFRISFMDKEDAGELIQDFVDELEELLLVRSETKPKVKWSPRHEYNPSRTTI